MSEPVFFRRVLTPSLGEIAEWTGAKAPEGADLSAIISGLAPLDQGGPGDLVFLDNPKYSDQLGATRAAACLMSAKYAARTPAGVVALVTPEPYRAFAIVAGKLYPAAARPQWVALCRRAVGQRRWAHQ